MYKCKCGNTKFNIQTVPVVRFEHEQMVKLPKIEFVERFICVKCGDIYPGTVNVKAITKQSRKCCLICGNENFTARQVCYHDIIVDSNNNFIKNIGISDSEEPYGPYCCTKCHTEYEDLDSFDISLLL